MRLEALYLSNFKGFNAPTVVPLSNINLLYGANSAGKSSILQSLLLMKQNLEPSTGTFTSDLDFRGPLVDLGGFEACVTAHDLNRPIELGLDVSDTPLDPYFGFSDAIRYRFQHAWSDETRSAHLSRVALIDPQAGRRIEWSERKSGPGLFIHGESALNALVETWQAGMRSRGYDLELESGDLTFARNWLKRSPGEAMGWLPFWSPRHLVRGRPGRPVGGSLNASKRRLLQSFVYDWQGSMFEQSMAIDNLLQRTKYVGPLRQAPQRIQVDGGSAFEGMGVRGERASVLLARDTELLWRVNAALELLDIPYEVVSEGLGSPAISSALGELSALVLRDKRTHILVTPGDVGFGVSQILPVILQLLLSSNGIVCVEQPEIHLHPRLQARLADIIIASATLRNNQVIIETHSEHLLLRLQRRIRSATIGAADVNVLFVDRGEVGSVITHVALDDRGQMQTAWPAGFFDERLSDLLAKDDDALRLSHRLGE